MINEFKKMYEINNVWDGCDYLDLYIYIYKFVLWY